MKNNNSAASVNNAAVSANTTIITEETTIKELCKIVNAAAARLKAADPEKVPDDTPTYKFLRENVNEVASAADMTVYENGFAAFRCEAGTVVLRLKNCCRGFSYEFNPGDYPGEVPSHSDVPASVMELLPWTVAVAMFGEQKAAANSANRTGDRRRTDNVVNVDGEELDLFEAFYDERSYVGVDELAIANVEAERLERKAKASLTERQEEVMDYGRRGLTHQEIADELGVARRTVSTTMERARRRMQDALADELPD